MAQENQPLKVDLNETVYDFLGLPEGDANIALYIRYIVVALNQKINDELLKEETQNNPLKLRKLELLRDIHLPGLVDEIEKAKRTGDISHVLSSYSMIDLSRKKDELKELERSNSLSNKDLNDIINDRMKIWTRMYKEEDRIQYNSALFAKRTEYIDHVLKIDSKKTLYSLLNLPETPSEVLKKIDVLRKGVSYLDKNGIEDTDVQRIFMGIDKDSSVEEIRSDGSSKDKDRVNPLVALKNCAPFLRERLDSIYNEYRQNGNIENLLSGFAGVDLVLKKVILDNKVVNKELTEADATFLMKKYNHAWAILSNPDLKKRYDIRLERVRRRDAIKNEAEKKKQIRKDLVEDEIMLHGDITAFDKSGLKGDKYQYGRLDGLPVFQWLIKEYPGGKKLIMSTNAMYKDNPKLDERVEVYAHGEFIWGTMLRVTDDGKLSSTYKDETCEVISVRKVDRDGNETVTYGIAQTKASGYWDNLTGKQIDELRKRKIPVIESDEFRDRNRNKSIYDINSKKPRKRSEIYEITKVRKPTSFGDKLIKLNRIIDKIGLEIPDYMIPTKIIEKRVPIKMSSEDFSDTDLVFDRDPNRRYKVLVFDPVRPVRYEINPATQADIARVMLSDFVFDKFKEGNGHFIGVLDDRHYSLTTPFGLDDTIRACQYASKYPGTLVKSRRVKRVSDINNLGEAFEYLERRDRERKQQLEARSARRVSDSMDFYGE